MEQITQQNPDTNSAPVPAPQPAQQKQKSSWRLPMILTALIVIAATAVSLYGYKHYYVKTVKAVETGYFSIVSVSPDDNSQGNDPNTPITMTFSQPVEPNSLRGYFSVNPMVPGTFSQGDTPNQVVFTPKFSFNNGTSVRVLIDKGLESVSGARFTNDYNFNFFTKTADRTIDFGDGDFISNLQTVAPNTKVEFDLNVGDNVDANSSINLYKGTVDQLLSSLAYTDQANDGSVYVSQQLVGNKIDTSTFQKISSAQGVSSTNGTYDFQQGPGLYYVEADDSAGTVLGFIWINVTDQGLLVRQDDQHIYLASQNTENGDTSQSVQVTAYNLQDKPTIVGGVTVANTGTIPLVYPQTADILVGQTDQGVIIVPLSLPDTEADTRVDANLSTLGNIYVQTDRPAYQAGDTVQVSGIARLDNDAQYTLPAAGTQVNLMLVNSTASTTVMQQSTTVNADGVFSTALKIPDSLAPDSGDQSLSLILKAQLEDDTAKPSTLISYTTLDLEAAPPAGHVSVQFDKEEYTADQSVVAHITVVDANGAPLANQQVTYDEYTKSYYESDPDSVANYGTDWGYQTPDGDQTVTLDGQGKATITLPADTSSISQATTLEAKAMVNGQAVYGAHTVLVHAGSVVLSFAPSQSTYHPGDTTITRVLARDLSGNPIPNFAMNYEFYSSDYDETSQTNKETVVAQGTAETDANGQAVIYQPISIQEEVFVRVQAKDGQGNVVEADQSYTMQVDPSANAIGYYHQPVLASYDIATDKQSYNVGDTANLTIHSPKTQNVWITIERGRVYKNEWVQLQQGDNQYAIPITSTLVPSFVVMLNTFDGGTLDTEGMGVAVNNPAQTLHVTVTADQLSYAANGSATLTINTTDASGDPVPATVLVDILNNSIFNLWDKMPGSGIAWNFYQPRQDTTTFSASTLGVGTGGGCGGGDGEDYQYIPNPSGTTAYWNPNVTTDSNGTAKITVPLPAISGSYRVMVVAASDTTAVGQTQSTINVQ